MGIEVAMVTGDNQRTAEAIANRPVSDRVFADVLPEHKADESEETYRAKVKWWQWLGTGLMTPRL